MHKPGVVKVVSFINRTIVFRQKYRSNIGTGNTAETQEMHLTN